MSAGRLSRWLAGYAALLVLASVGLYAYVAVDRFPARPLATVVSVWEGGERRARAVTSGDPDALLVEESRAPGAQRVFEEVLDEGPLLTTSAPLFGMSFVSTRDGVKATFGKRVAYATPDDLLKLGAYGAKTSFKNLSLNAGVERTAALKFLARELKVSRSELLSEGKLERVAMRRRVAIKSVAEELKPARLREAVIAAGHYLARTLRGDGSYRYEIDAFTGEDVPGYNWPRHAGATWFLAQAAHLSGEPLLREAVRSAAFHLVERATQTCGKHPCIGEGDEVNLGSSSLALLSYVELVENGIAPELAWQVRELSAFLRSLQREDGEFMHVYDLREGHPVDVQKPYFAGEAALALSRAHRVTRDPADLEASKRALAKLVSRPSAWLTSRYFWTSEHWTCQAMAENWERAPDRRALEFCMQWQEANRKGMLDGNVAPEYDGAHSSNPLVAPRFTGAASRMEAGVATLAVARRAEGVSEHAVRELEEGVRRTLAFLLRQQFLPGPTHLMVDPALVHGGFSGGATDFHVRIDFPQHAGAALLRYLRLLES